jgi:hypothetical protein
MKLRNDRREERRAEALERNKAWGLLSKDQQIQSLKSRRGESKRQMKKLQGIPE